MFYFSKRVGPSYHNRSALNDIQNTLDSSSDKFSDSCGTPNKKTTPNSHDTFIRAILDNAKNSTVVSALRNIKFSLRDCCKKVYETLNVRDEIFEISVNTQNSRPEWIAARQFRITGSRYSDELFLQNFVLFVQ